MKNNKMQFSLGIFIVSVMVLSIALTPVTAKGGTIVIGTSDSITNLDPADAYDYFS